MAISEARWSSAGAASGGDGHRRSQEQQRGGAVSESRTKESPIPAKIHWWRRCTTFEARRGTANMDPSSSPAAVMTDSSAVGSATPSKRAAEASGGVILPVAARTRSHATAGAGEPAQEAAAVAAASPRNEPAETPSKRPRVSEEGLSAGERAAAAAAAAAAGASSNSVAENNDTSSSAPAPRNDEIIDMTGDTPTPPRGALFGAGGGPPGVQIKTDPGAQIKPDPGAPKTAITMEEDSDIEILTPSRFPRPGSSGSNNNIGMDMDVGEDGLMVAKSNVTNANIDYAHMHHSCGMHKFVFDAQIHGYPNDNERYCEKCYCFVCDAPASECKEWSGGGGNYEAHCHSHDKDKTWVGMREATLRARGITKKPEDHGEVTMVPPSNPYQRHSYNPYQSNPQMMTAAQGGMHHEQLTSLIHNEFLARLAEDGGNEAAREQQRHERTKEKKDMRITEVLSDNFRKCVSLRENAATTDPQITGKENNQGDGGLDPSSKPPARPPHQKMEGDIPTLSLHNSFFVQGIKIGWPFPEVCAAS